MAYPVLSVLEISFLLIGDLLGSPELTVLELRVEKKFDLPNSGISIL